MNELIVMALVVLLLIIVLLLINVGALKAQIEELNLLLVPTLEDSIALNQDVFKSLGWNKDKTIKDREFYSYSVEKHTDGTVHYTDNYQLSYNDITGETLLYIVSISNKVTLFKGVLKNKSDLRHLMEITIIIE